MDLTSVMIRDLGPFKPCICGFAPIGAIYIVSSDIVRIRFDIYDFLSLLLKNSNESARYRAGCFDDSSSEFFKVEPPDQRAHLFDLLFRMEKNGSLPPIFISFIVLTSVDIPTTSKTKSFNSSNEILCVSIV